MVNKNKEKKSNFFKKTSRLFFILFLIVYPFGQLTRIPFSFLPSEVNVYLLDIFLLFSFLNWLLFRCFIDKKTKLPLLTGEILSFFAIGLVSLLVNITWLKADELFVASLYLFRWLTYAGIYFIVYEFASSGDEMFYFSNVTTILLSLGFLIAILGIVQYLFLPDLRTFEIAHWDPHYYRVVGTFLDPGFTGLVLVFILALIVGKFLDLSKTNKHRKTLLLFAGFVTYVSLALTYSRSSFLAFLASAGVSSWFKKSAKFFFVSILMMTLTILILPRQPGGEGVKLERWASVKARVKSWRHALVIFADHPIFGVGFNAYRYAQKNYGFLTQNWRLNHAGAGVDSSLLFVLATTGLMGLLIYCYLGLRLTKIVKIGNLSGNKKNFRISFLAILGALFVHSFFLNSLFYTWIMVWIWTLMGSLSGSRRVRK